MKKTSKFGYVVAVVVNLILFYVLSNLVRWKVPFITEDWDSVLWAFWLSMGATIVANVLYLAYDARWFKRLTQIGLNALAFIVTYTLYTVFPFDLGAFNVPVRIALVLGMAGVVIATVVDAVALLFGR